MKYLAVVSFILLMTVVSCKMDPPFLSYSNVTVDITEKNVPENGIINQPVIITAVCSAPNGCWNQLHFVFKERENFKYDLYAVGNYESYGVCPEVLVMKDTLITLIPDVAGKYVITTLISPDTIERDTIVVTAGAR
ncbi:MAG: hypothetical protein MUP53_09370 [Bacteroidales bacterium]|nr:hypothetical protein [Bacteroidales bacterium]TFH49371.1 MAG: hypothetical protein E4G92_01990 [Bacteroidia bacterium]